MEMQSSIEVGDEIVTTAGIYGTITEIDDDYGIVTLEVAPGTRRSGSPGPPSPRA